MKLKTLAIPLSILASTLSTLAVPLLQDLDDGDFIVTLNDDVDMDGHMSSLTSMLGSTDAITHHYKSAFKGYAGSFSKTLFQALHATEMGGHIASVEKDGVSYASEIEAGSELWYLCTFFTPLTQTPAAPWGLERISQREALPPGSDVRALAYDYTYPSPSGAGVDVYVIDTGIRISHVDFGGRASYGWAAPAFASADDDNEHGTHVAGTIGGATYGVAKGVHLVAVKVLNGTGSGTNSDIVSGLDYALDAAAQSGRPSVISMSLGGALSPVLDQAVSVCVRQGVHVVVAAGNEGVDASQSSPAHVEEVITVGASTVDDMRPAFSNYGATVDIFAPGLNVTSASNQDDYGTLSLSGTSMATPHVSGALASLLSQEGSMAPAEASQRLKNIATKNALTNIVPDCGLFCFKRGLFGRQSPPNNLLYNNA